MPAQSVVQNIQCDNDIISSEEKKNTIINSSLPYKLAHAPYSLWVLAAWPRDGIKHKLASTSIIHILIVTAILRTQNVYKATINGNKSCVYLADNHRLGGRGVFSLVSVKQH